MNDSAGALVDRVRSADLLDLVPRLTLITLILASHYSAGLMIVLAGVAGAVWFEPRRYRSPWLWIPLAGGLALFQFRIWYRIDDHVMLSTYWALAVGLAFTTRDPRRCLADSARVLIALTFLLAAAWKVGTPEFRDGTFFEYALLQDSRFEFVAEHIGGLSDLDREQNNARVARLNPHGQQVAVMEAPPTIGRLASVFTFWGIFIEGLLAIVWIAPLSRRWQWVRPVALLVFVGATYLVVPVGGFGAILLTLAVATTDSDTRWRVPLLAGIVAVALWAPVWQAFIAR